MTETTCAVGVEHLMDYIEGVIAPDLRDALTTHVAGCPRCTAFIASYQATPQIIRDATSITLSPVGAQSLLTFLRSRS